MPKEAVVGPQPKEDIDKKPQKPEEGTLEYHTQGIIDSLGDEFKKAELSKQLVEKTIPSAVEKLIKGDKIKKGTHKGKIRGEIMLEKIGPELSYGLRKKIIDTTEKYKGDLEEGKIKLLKVVEETAPKEKESKVSGKRPKDQKEWVKKSQEKRIKAEKQLEEQSKAEKLSQEIKDKQQAATEKEFGKDKVKEEIELLKNKVGVLEILEKVQKEKQISKTPAAAVMVEEVAEGEEPDPKVAEELDKILAEAEEVPEEQTEKKEAQPQTDIETQKAKGEKVKEKVVDEKKEGGLTKEDFTEGARIYDNVEKFIWKVDNVDKEKDIIKLISEKHKKNMSLNESQITKGIQDGRFQKPKRKMKRKQRKEKPKGKGVQPQIETKVEEVSKAKETIVDKKKEEELTKDNDILGMKIKNKQGIEMKVVDVPESEKGNITLKNKKGQKSFISLKRFKENIEKGIFKSIK